MAAIFIQPRGRVIDSNGNPVAGARLYFFNAGTTTPKTVYQDPALTIPQPVQGDGYVEADSAGLLPLIYLSGTYKVRVADGSGVLIYEADNQDAPLTTSGGVLGIALGGTGASTPEQARINLGVPAQTTFDALASQVGSIQSEINSYPTFGALAAKSEIQPADLSNDFAPVCIQRQLTLNSVRSSLSGTIPLDNTSPLRSEGDTIFSVNFTPKRGDTVIRVRAVLHLAGSARTGVIALFNTIGANDQAIAAVGFFVDNTSVTGPYEIEHEFASPGTAQLTIQVNAGASGSYFINGSSTAGLFNGKLISRLILEEYQTP